MVASEGHAAQMNATPIARIIGHAEVATKPREFSVASAWAIQKVLKKAGVTLDEVEVIEVNEAFADKYLELATGTGSPAAKTGEAAPSGH